ncbi:PAS domain-containing protein [Fulvimarina sp. MAC8]|uniref:PAS domain-containing protein n=1 Tax=Fulvimarina sp. MAC8 TaxID=3162874 RepID=UPI0032F08286
MTASLESSLAKFAEEARVAVTIAETGAPDLPLNLVNPRFCELSGYEADELIGKNCRLLQGTLRDQPGRHEIRRFLTDPATTSIRTTLINFRKDGTHFVNLVLMTKLSDSRARVRYIFASQFDVTKIAEEQMLGHDETLQEEVQRIGSLVREHRHMMNTSFETIANSMAQIAKSRMALDESV